ncbi:hypothetical protein GGS21DRAFT_494252 [Xylaria nigripes]|nr:hypothetical protein GGS21DRAFT_494252 [Xylaria nigripes]
MTETAFPAPNMDYGGPIDISILENEALRLDVQKSMSRWRKPTNWTKATAPHRNRKLREGNRLHQLETHLAEVEDPEKFWMEVIKIAPPKKWMDKVKLMGFLSTSRPMDKPSNGKLWSQAREWLNEAIRQGGSQGWNDNILINVPAITAEFWEAIRIIGDSSEGFGTFPTFIRERMLNAGFGWIAINPRKRVIPKCWVQWAKINNVKYKSTMSIDEMKTHEIAPSKGALYSDKEYKDRETPKTNRDEAHIDEGDMDDASDEEHTCHRSVSGRILIDDNTQAKRALERLESQDVAPYQTKLCILQVQQPDEATQKSEIWKTINTNLVRMNKQTMQAHNEVVDETQSFIRRTLKQAVINGPIEGQIRRILNESMDRIVNTIHETSAQQDKAIREIQTNVSRLMDQSEMLLRQENIINELQTSVARLGAELEKKKANEDVYPTEKGKEPAEITDDSDEDSDGNNNEDTMRAEGHVDIQTEGSNKRKRATDDEYLSQPKRFPLSLWW